MDTTSIQQSPVNTSAAAINVAALGVPVTVTTTESSVVAAPTAAPAVPITQAIANQIHQRIEKLVASREAWETGIYARSNETLYGVIKDSFVLYKELTEKSDATKYKRLGFDGYLEQKGYTFKAGTPLTAKIIRCVFAATDRRRLSTYHTVLRVAVAQNWKLEEFSANIAAHGGVQEISLGKATGALTAKQKAEAARDAVLAQTLATVASPELAKLAAADGIGAKSVAVMTQEADGSFTVHAVVQSDTAVNAALAAYFSSHKDELKVVAQQAAANNAAASREQLIDTAAQSIAA
jgi:hypothetical protein